MTKEQIGAALQLVAALGQAVREAGPSGIPSGHMYAMVCGSCDLPSYQGALGLLKRAKLIEERACLLLWIGPEVQS